MTSIFRPFPLPLTGRQWFYLTFLQGVGAGVIDGGANFGVAYAMYHGQDVVKMWVFSKNTIAGDLGVTPIIQCLASMLITSTLVHSDLHHSAIKPLPYVYPHVEHLPDPRELLSRSYRRQQREETRLHPTTSDDTAVGVESEKQQKRVSPTQKKGLSYYYWMLVRFIFEGTERNMLLARPGFANWWGRVIWTAAQGAGIGIIFGFPIWCLAVLILGPIYGNGNLGNRWAPQIIKMVYGAIVGWITNPVIAILALGSQADHHLVVIEHDEEAEVAGESQVEGPVETIQEEDDGDHAQTLAPPATPLRVPPSPRSVAPSSPIARTSPLVTPRRVRATSSASSLPGRPPLTANVSRLSPLPPSHLPLATEAETPSRPTMGRERGMTVSSVGSGFSYALGGTGGRAQRPRANTSASFSNRPQIPDVTVSNVDAKNAGQGQGRRPRADSSDVFGRRVTAPTGVPTFTSGAQLGAGRPRSASTLAALGESRESREVERS